MSVGSPSSARSQLMTSVSPASNLKFPKWLPPSKIWPFVVGIGVGVVVSTGVSGAVSTGVGVGVKVGDVELVGVGTSVGVARTPGGCTAQADNNPAAATPAKTRSFITLNFPAHRLSAAISILVRLEAL